MPPLKFFGEKPRWYFLPVRVLLVTFIVTLLSFAVSLFVGILGVLVTAKLHGVRPDLSEAYRLVALPAACGVAAVVLLSATVMELRHYRRAKTLSSIERQMGRAN